jgi:hypothetical protein
MLYSDLVFVCTREASCVLPACTVYIQIQCKKILSISMTSSSASYVSIPRCPVIFYDTNYGEFVAFIRIHMRSLQLWSVLTGEISCPPRPIVLVPPTPPHVPHALAADATQAAQDAAKTAEVAIDDSYDQEVLPYSEAPGPYRDSLAAFT